MTMTRRTSIFLASCVLLLTFTSHGLAHDPGLSRIRVIEAGSEWIVELEGAHSDFDRLLEPGEERSAQTSERLLEVVLGTETVSPTTTSLELLDDDPRWRMAFSAIDPRQELRIVGIALDRLPRGHRHYLVHESPEGTVKSRALLDERSPSLVLRERAATAAPAPSAASPLGSPRRTSLEPSPAAIGEGTRGETRAAPDRRSAGNIALFTRLGFEHILGGLDHLLFVLAIALSSGTALARLKILTGFTIAHSISLALATLGWITLPAALVEPIIALSIVWLGVEAWRGRAGAPRLWLTFSFGLVHGLGFAGALGELGLERGAGFAASLFGFNLGVEIGQILVLALAWPLIEGLRRWRKGRVPVTGWAAAGIAITGSYWFVERVS